MLPGGVDLQAAIDRSADGDTLVLQGEHHGPIRITRKLTLEGEPGAVLLGTGEGSVITVIAPGVVVRGLTIRGSGRNLERMDAGVFVEKSAAGAIVEENRIEGNLYGIYLHGAENAVARKNEIVGIDVGRVNEAGNGVSVWNAPGAKVLDNDIRFGRDGIFVIASQRNVFSGNRFRDLRFAIHYMYTDDSEVSRQHLDRQYRRLRDHVLPSPERCGPTFLMATAITDCCSTSPMALRSPATLFGDGSSRRSVGRGRACAAWRRGSTACHHPTKLNSRSPWERATDPRNASSSTTPTRMCSETIGLKAVKSASISPPGSEGNEIEGNAFVNNRNQVKYVGTRYLDWSKGGRGNYWSDNPAFDLDADGIADTAYRPNDLVDKVLWTAPQAKVLINSPAMQVIRWAQAQFPALLPGGVVDSHPLISPPARPEESERGPS